MDRCEFIRGLLTVTGVSAIPLPQAAATEPTPVPCDDLLKRAESERDFINNRLADLLEATEQQLRYETRLKLIEHCGRKMLPAPLVQAGAGEAGSWQRRQASGGLPGQLRGVAGERPPPHPLREGFQGVLLPRRQAPPSSGRRPPLRVHPRDPPGRLRDRTWASAPCQHPGDRPPWRPDLSLRGARRRLRERARCASSPGPTDRDEAGRAMTSAVSRR